MKRSKLISQIREEYKQENKKTLGKEFICNFSVGFFSWLSVGLASVFLSNNVNTFSIFIIYAICNLFQRHFEAYSINRPSYTTFLGQKIVFPKGMWLGSIIGLIIVKLIFNG